MNCPGDGILRARLDNELNGTELQVVNGHLVSCAECRNRLEIMSARTSALHEDFAALAPRPDQISVDPAIAYAHFKQGLRTELEAQAPSWLSRVFAPRWRPAWGLVAAACVVAGFLSIAPARSWAQKILAMLRVRKIAAVSIDPSTLLEGNDNNSHPYKLINQLLSDSVVVTMEPGKPEIVPSVALASQLAGFRLRTLNGGGAPRTIQVNGEAAFHMTLNRERIQSVLDEINRSDIQVPASVDGATVAVHIPKVVVSEYGTCPLRHEFKTQSGQSVNEKSLADRKIERLSQKGSDNHCTFLVQALSPTVSVPPDLNMADVAEAALEFAGMSASEAHSFTQTVDWSSTLVVPVPRNTSSYQTVNVDGVEGTLVLETLPEGNRYSLLWVKNGVIYGLSGHGTPDDAVNLAASLR